MDDSAFYGGWEFAAHKFLGAHPDGEGAVFRTYAPAAVQVGLIGTFSDWQEIPMRRVRDGNFWEVQAETVPPGSLYKFRIHRPDGGVTDHADPYAFGAELRPATASVYWGDSLYRFRDEAWMAGEGRWGGPPNIYELHAGSWQTRPEGEGPDRWYFYGELADRLVPYLLEMGYTHLELMPLTEYPCDESWGYQATGFFSPTARYGHPDGLRYLVDRCHRAGIGVLLDFVPVHFAVNDYALWNYDGTALYEYPHPDVGYNQWGSCNFCLSRGEVRSFLQSAACYWLEEFHLDGLRLDAVSHLIYWQGDPARGENGPGLAFARSLTDGLHARFPRTLLIAEDSTARPGTTAPTREGGLGFDGKWDLGWMNDTLAYFRLPPDQRAGRGELLAFSMHYHYGERYLLPFSHDETVHGKGTMLRKMYGTPAEQLAQLRALYLYMYAHPGAKLDFMGNEWAQAREWDPARPQDRDCLEQPEHRAFWEYRRALHHFWKGCPALWAADRDPAGFAWLEGGRGEAGVFAFERRGAGQRVLALFQFGGRPLAWRCPAGMRLRPLFTADGGPAPAVQNGVLLLPAFGGWCWELG